MARYKHIDMSPWLLPVDLQALLVPGSFVHALHPLVDQLDVSAFDAHYRNDENGAPALATTMLLKAVLLAYCQGMVTSRSIEHACCNRGCPRFCGTGPQAGHCHLTRIHHEPRKHDHRLHACHRTSIHAWENATSQYSMTHCCPARRR